MSGTSSFLKNLGFRLTGAVELAKTAYRHPITQSVIAIKKEQLGRTVDSAQKVAREITVSGFQKVTSSEERGKLLNKGKDRVHGLFQAGRLTVDEAQRIYDLYEQDGVMGLMLDPATRSYVKNIISAPSRMRSSEHGKNLSSAYNALMSEVRLILGMTDQPIEIDLDESILDAKSWEKNQEEALVFGRLGMEYLGNEDYKKAVRYLLLSYEMMPDQSETIKEISVLLARALTLSGQTGTDSVAKLLVENVFLKMENAEDFEQHWDLLYSQSGLFETVIIPNVLSAELVDKIIEQYEQERPLPAEYKVQLFYSLLEGHYIKTLLATEGSSVDGELSDSLKEALIYLETKMLPCFIETGSQEFFDRMILFRLAVSKIDDDTRGFFEFFKKAVEGLFKGDTKAMIDYATDYKTSNNMRFNGLVASWLDTLQE